MLIGIGCYNIINETYQGEIRGANKGQTELPENGKPKGKQNGKPILPETANGLPLENGFANVKSFITQCKKVYGLTPAQYKKKLLNR